MQNMAELLRNFLLSKGLKFVWLNLRVWLWPTKSCVGHPTAFVYDLIRKAETRILLHAAFYPKYTDSQIQPILETVLKRDTFKEIQVIFLDETANHFAESCKILRGPDSETQIKKEIESGVEFFSKLEAKSKKVSVYKSKSLLCCPIVIVDDFIIVGHYAHSAFYAPSGYWHIHKCSKGKVDQYLTQSLNTLQSKGLITLLGPVDAALCRYISEFVYAKDCAQKVS